MKKFLMGVAVLLAMSCMQAFAVETILLDSRDIAKNQNHISEVGFKILNSNGIDKRTIFLFDTRKTVNAYSTYRDRTIVLYRGLYSMMNSDDELAAVLSHEISHSVDSYDGIFRGFFSYLGNMCSPKKYEYKADKRAVDYMVAAGYNPVAMIVIFNKAFSQDRYDWWSTHPLASRRMMEVYEYIYKKYPEYLAKNVYKDNIYYQNFLLTSQKNRTKFQKKIETKSKGSIYYL